MEQRKWQIGDLVSYATRLGSGERGTGRVWAIEGELLRLDNGVTVRLAYARESTQDRPVIGQTYRHYKGDLYTVVGFAFHHETRQELVLYRSHLRGWVNARPLLGTPTDPDGWLTPVVNEQGNERPRFASVDPKDSE